MKKFYRFLLIVQMILAVIIMILSLVLITETIRDLISIINSSQRVALSQWLVITFIVCTLLFVCIQNIVIEIANKLDSESKSNKVDTKINDLENKQVIETICILGYILRKQEIEVEEIYTLGRMELLHMLDILIQELKETK